MFDKLNKYSRRHRSGARPLTDSKLVFIQVRACQFYFHFQTFFMKSLYYLRYIYNNLIKAPLTLCRNNKKQSGSYF